MIEIRKLSTTLFSKISSFILVCSLSSSVFAAEPDSTEAQKSEKLSNIIQQESNKASTAVNNPSTVSQTETTAATQTTPNTIDEASSSPPPESVITLKPYTAHYDILDGRDDVGTATRRLTFLNGLWTLSQSTSIKRWYYKYLFEEESVFKLQDGHLLSQNYKSLTKRSFKDDRTITSEFDWDKHKETGEYNRRTWELDLNQPVFDHLNYQIGLRVRAPQQNPQEYLRVSYKGERANYHFVNEGYETINTPLGEFKTILWTQQPRYKSDKIFYMWLAPELDYLPVQMAQIRNGKTEGTIRLKQLIMNK